MAEANVSSNGSCSPYDSSSYVAVAALSAAIAAISLGLLLAVLFILVLFKKHKFFSQRLILYLAVSSILVNIAIILHRVDYQNQDSEFYVRFCQLGGYLDQTFHWMLLMSVCSIVVYTSLRILLQADTQIYELVYVFFIFIFPITFTWIPFVYNAYGQAGAWCWIVSESTDTCEPHITGRILQILLWFGPLYVMLIVLLLNFVILFIHQCYKRKRMGRSNTSQGHMVSNSGIMVREEEIKMLTIYPVLFFFLNVFPLINRTYHMTDRGEPSIALWYLDAIASPLTGFLVTAIYFLDPETRKRVNLKHIGAATADMFRKGAITSISITIPDDGTPRSDSYIKTTAETELPARLNSKPPMKPTHWKKTLQV